MPAAFNVTNREVIIAMAAHYGMPAIYFNNFFRNQAARFLIVLISPNSFARRQSTSTAS
jgi:hypothetical protein